MNDEEAHSVRRGNTGDERECFAGAGRSAFDGDSRGYADRRGERSAADESTQSGARGASKAGERRRNNARAENIWRNAGDMQYRRIQPGRICAGAGNAQGRAAGRRAGGSTEGGAAATGAWGGLDQGVHDTPVMGGQTGKLS